MTGSKAKAGVSADLSPMPPSFAQIAAKASWADLMLPERERRMLASIVEQLRHPAAAQGGGRRDRAGAGTFANAVLFAGPGGTGKTLAARVTAAELGLGLYRVELRGVVSKYIGETEKNLRRLFDAARAGGAILLFDEADALFGKRSEIEDGSDRYANAATAGLLRRIESHCGLVILTTNRKQAIDPAFLRRLRFVLDFPLAGRSA